MIPDLRSSFFNPVNVGFTHIQPGSISIKEACSVLVQKSFKLGRDHITHVGNTWFNFHSTVLYRLESLDVYNRAQQIEKDLNDVIDDKDIDEDTAIFYKILKSKETWTGLMNAMEQRNTVD